MSDPKPFLPVNKNTLPLLEEISAPRYTVDELAELMNEARITDDSPSVTTNAPPVENQSGPVTDANTVLAYTKETIEKMGVGSIIEGILPVSGINLTNLFATLPCTRILAELPILDIPIRTPKLVILASGLTLTVNSSSFDVIKLYIAIVSLLRANPLVATRSHIAEMFYSRIVKRVGYLPAEAATAFATFCQFANGGDHLEFLRASQDVKTLPGPEVVFQYFNAIRVTDMTKLAAALGMIMTSERMAEDIIDDEMTRNKERALEKFKRDFLTRNNFRDDDLVAYCQYLNVQLTVDIINTYEQCIFDILANCIPAAGRYREYIEAQRKISDPASGFERDMMAVVINFDKIVINNHAEKTIFEQRKNYSLLRKACAEDACAFDLWNIKRQMSYADIYGSLEEYEDLFFYFQKYKGISQGYFLVLNDIDHEAAVLDLEKKLWRTHVMPDELNIAEMPVVEHAYMTPDISDHGPVKSEGMWFDGMHSGIVIPTKRESPRQNDILCMLFYVQSAPILFDPCPLNINRERKGFSHAKCHYCKTQLPAWNYFGDENVCWFAGLYHYISDHDACISHEFYLWLSKQFFALKQFCTSQSQ